MSISAALKGSRNGSSKKSWSRDEMRTVVVMMVGGATHEQIAEATGHPKASVGYVLRNRLSNDADVLKNTGFNDLEEIEAEINRLENDVAEAS